MSTNKQAQAIISDIRLKHGSGDAYAPIIRWDEFQVISNALEAAEKRIAELEVQPVTLVLPHDSEVELVADRCNRHRKAKQAAGITVKGE